MSEVASPFAPLLLLPELAWARPAGLGALLLPLLLLLAARSRRRPPARATGTLALWRRAEAEV
ncbi:MAG: hypothetical protein AB1726_02525, partial [Planctomycetota bacterium]